MMFDFHPEAEEEFFQAVEYYESCEPGLGYDFSIEVVDTINRIITHPFAWQSIEKELRRCLTNRFPYGVIYSIEKNKNIFILAVMNLHRAPDYWKDRLTDD